MTPSTIDKKNNRTGDFLIFLIRKNPGRKKEKKPAKRKIGKNNNALSNENIQC